MIRTSDSLNEELPIKMAREKFLRKCYFFHGQPLNHPQKCFSHRKSTNLEIWVENSVPDFKHIENRKHFTEGQNFDILRNNIWSQKIPPPPKP